MQIVEAYSNSEFSLFREKEKLSEVAFNDITIPSWWTSALQRISYLLQLPENWDSYGAKKIDVSIAYHSIDILQKVSRPDIPPPNIVPTVNGRLQFEWHTNGIDLEFEVLSAASISVSYENMNNGMEWDKVLDYNLAELTDIIRTLVAE